jgi:tetratricopeptide (TPR) repeat protein
MQKKYIILLLLIAASFISCKKFLDAKPDASLAVPATLEDVQAMLDRNNVLNTENPIAGEGSTDNYYISDADYAALSTDGFRNMYTWGDELYYAVIPNEWSRIYTAVYITQLAVETLQHIERNATNAALYDNLLGQALFHRARFYHTAVTMYAKAYDPATASSTPGIPLRMTTDFNQPSVRASVEASYAQIVSDLQTAIPGLPVTATHVMRPSRAAAYAQIARVYLSMGFYDKAGLYADSSLQLKNDLLDYNTISATPAFPFTLFNKETLFASFANTNNLVTNTKAMIDSNLYVSYATNDLRKTLFFKDNGNKRFSFRGSYTGSAAYSTGVCTDEMYLTRAESFARGGNVAGAMSDLNALLVKRYKTGFVPLVAGSAAQALSLVLTERRKELLMRDIRWMDLKRLNRETTFAVTLRRVVNGQTIELLPGSNRYALPIPAAVIAASGMQQNER